MINTSDSRAEELRAALDCALELARCAADAVADVYSRRFDVEAKSDGSPITEADRRANEIILKGLADAFPDDAVLSEESRFEGDANTDGRLWMVDPLDGTADFAGRTNDFAIMIGLCLDGRPVLGVVAAPALGRTWFGGTGLGAWERTADGDRALAIEAPAPDAAIRVLVSRKHRPPKVEALIDALGHAETFARGSVGVKCGLIAAGEADVYLHPSRGTSAWDACAPQAIMEAAGGLLTAAHGAPLRYDPTRPANAEGLLAATSTLHRRVLSAVGS